MDILRSLILAAADSDSIQHLVTNAPLSRGVVRRFVAGESLDQALGVTERLAVEGLQLTLDYLGEHASDTKLAENNVRAYLDLLPALYEAGLTDHAEVSVKLSAIGQQFDQNLARTNAARICAAATQIGTTVTLDMEDHTTTDSTLSILVDLRKDYPSTGAVLQACLRRTEADCRELASSGTRVRLCKGAYAEPTTVAYQNASEVDRCYVRCVNVLLAGESYPMFATHDPRLIGIITRRAQWYGRAIGDYEHQMLYGIRPQEQRRLISAGQTVRVYVPYGTQWYPYLMRRLAERPANLAFFFRALLTRS